MQGSGVIAAYERVLAIMHDMHAAACAERWDDLVALEKSCRGIVDQLTADGADAALPASQAGRKMEIIRQVLELDAAIRDKTEPWLRNLQAFLGTRECERKLHAAYGASDGA